MSTNYYARILPSKGRKEEIKQAIDCDDSYLIRKLVSETYDSPYDRSPGDIESELANGTFFGEIHLGMRSGGWKFLWSTNWFIKKNGHIEWESIDDSHETGRWVEDGTTIIKLYDLNKESIKDFIFREDVEIYDEYDELQFKDTFWEMALEWCPDGFDSDFYYKEHPSKYRFAMRNDLIYALAKEGFELSSDQSEFYSDGLRFSTSNG